MSYASGTTHYNLPQTVGSDKRDWTDTNQAFSDIDAAIYGAAQGASAATSAIETINGQIETITGKQAVDEGNISTLSGKVSTLESTVGTQAAAIADVRQDLQDNIESKKEASATSTRAYNVGDTFYYNDVLYKATAPIAIGGTIVPSTNCTAVTVMSEIQNQTAPTKVEITFVSTDVVRNVLNSLSATIDRSKITKNSLLYMIISGVATKVYDFRRINPDDTLYYTSCGSSASNLVIETLEIKNSDSSHTQGTVTSSGFAGTDYSATTLNYDGKYVLYY